MFVMQLVNTLYYENDKYRKGQYNPFGLIGYMVGIGTDFIAGSGSIADIGRTCKDFPLCNGTGYTVVDNIAVAAYNTFYIAGRLYE